MDVIKIRRVFVYKNMKKTFHVFQVGFRYKYIFIGNKLIKYLYSISQNDNSDQW